MTLRDLAIRGFRFYAPSNAAAIAGAAVATAVITGALLVGSSVRSSLRQLVLDKLGRTEWVVSRPGFFREALAGEMGGVAVIQIDGVLTRQADNRRSDAVHIYGVDDRFWKFHGVTDSTPGERAVAFSPALAAELESKSGDSILLHVEKPSAIPRESLHGRKEDAAKTIRLQYSGAVIPAREMGEFAIRPQQGPTKAAFVRLTTLERELGLPGRINTVLLDSAHEPDPNKFTLSDLGVTIHPNDECLTIATDSAVIPPPLEAAIAKTSSSNAPLLTYLVNQMSVGRDPAWPRPPPPTGDRNPVFVDVPYRSVPYSLVTAVTAPHREVASGSIVLNDWTARDLGLNSSMTNKVVVRLEYFSWDSQGALSTATAPLRLSAIIPTVDDRSMAPEYPGITDSLSLSSWDPPFPMNLKLVRPVDEDYWRKFRTTPKAFISLEDGRKIWGSRFGSATMVRAYGVDQAAFGARLRQAIRPEELGVSVVDARESGLQAAAGSTDFGEYFLYFSFFLLASALLLLVLFFQFGIEQRLAELGMLRSIGFETKMISRLFLAEGSLTAIAGSLIGIPLAIGYAYVVLYALKTVWRAAVGTSALTLYVSSESLILGCFSGIAFSVLTIWLTLRKLRKISPRQMLSGTLESGLVTRPGRWSKGVAAVSFVAGLSLVGLGLGGQIAPAEALFGGASLLLIASIAAVGVYLKGRGAGLTLSSAAQLGLRNTAWNPSRSALAIGLIGSATFLLVALESFRTQAPGEGLGGYSIVAESQVPIVYDMNQKQGQDALGLSSRRELAGLHFSAFRLKAGDDTSCLNLYLPRDPRVLGAPDDLLASSRFGFDWKILDQVDPSGAIPAVGDANSVQYILHKKIGDEIVLGGGGRLKIVGALTGSLLQSELIVSGRNFKQLFPLEQGFRFFLIQGPETAIGPLEDVLSDFGLDASSADSRLASYHQVENTYLSTFQMLGGLGLLLGTVGLSAVLLRNVLERGREVGLLRAVGFQSQDLSRMVLAENLALAVAGVGVGLITAMIAILPGLVGEHKHPPGVGVLMLVVMVPIVGLTASGLAIRAMHRRNLLESIRTGR